MDSLMDKNLKLQQEAVIKGQKYECRKLALQIAQVVDNANISKNLLENAEEIYEWLIKEL
jgi:hypothetical protein